MTSSKITLEKIIAVFGTEERGALNISVTPKGVKVTRGDVSLTAKTIDTELVPRPGKYTAVISENGELSVEKVVPSAKKTRQSPAFDRF